MPANGFALSLLNSGALPDSETAPEETGSNSTSDPGTAAAADAILAADPDSKEQETSAWRDELSARLNRYRSRRKLPPPRYPSLTLRLDPPVPVADAPQQAFEPTSEHALALEATTTVVPSPSVELPPAPSPRSVSGHSGAKIIEFPKYFQEPLTYEPPSAPPDQLAEPVMERPRILEVPEFSPPPPALGGITIEPTVRAEPEKRPGIDIPLQSASLTRRIVAAVVDVLMIAAGAAMFGFIFWKVVAVRPPRVQMLAMTFGMSFLFWAAYQYLLLVYGGKTVGLLAAGLELARFDGSRTSRSLRRWRVLASYLSAVSLGMGYAWVFLDEDVLCWHDRITRTYLAPRKRTSSSSASPSQE